MRSPQSAVVAEALRHAAGRPQTSTARSSTCTVRAPRREIPRPLAPVLKAPGTMRSASWSWRSRRAWSRAWCAATTTCWTSAVTLAHGALGSRRSSPARSLEGRIPVVDHLAPALCASRHRPRRRRCGGALPSEEHVVRRPRPRPLPPACDSKHVGSLMTDLEFACEGERCRLERTRGQVSSAPSCAARSRPVVSARCRASVVTKIGCDRTRAELDGRGSAVILRRTPCRWVALADGAARGTSDVASVTPAVRFSASPWSPRTDGAGGATPRVRRRLPGRSGADWRRMLPWTTARTRGRRAAPRAGSDPQWRRC